MSRALEAALLDVDDQRELDRRGVDSNGHRGAPGNQALGRTPSIALVRVRMEAVLGAAVESDEAYALRQSLIDLAAVATELAATMERPAPVRMAA